MARTQKAMCAMCGGSLAAGDAFCEQCGQPTQWATHETRVAWEIGQWRASRAAPVASSSADVRPVIAAPGSALALVEPPMRAPSSIAAPAVAARHSVVAAWMRRVARAIRSLVERRGTRPDAKRDIDAAPVDVAAARREAPNGAPATLSIVADPQPAAAPAPAMEERPSSEPIRAVDPAPVAAIPTASTRPTGPKKQTAPRKRPNRPTNKELLQKTLTVLTRVEQRLDLLEQEIAEIDLAVREGTPLAAPDATRDREKRGA